MTCEQSILLLLNSRIEMSWTRCVESVGTRIWDSSVVGGNRGKQMMP